jgi:hypothetical protein
LPLIGLIRDPSQPEAVRRNNQRLPHLRATRHRSHESMNMFTDALSFRRLSFALSQFCGLKILPLLVIDDDGIKLFIVLTVGNVVPGLDRRAEIAIP